jgi:hypothetical protein
MPLKTLAASAFGLLLGCAAAQAQATSHATAVAPPGSVPIAGWCNGSSGPCTVEASCPANTTIVSGYWWFIVPDGVAPAYGICGSDTGFCQTGNSTCAFATHIPPGCAAPAWNRQIGFLYAVCK